MAAAIAREAVASRGLEIAVDSAGVAASAGDPANTSACEVARANALALDEHEAKQLTRELVEGADYVVAMDPSHAERARELGARRVVCLDVADPYGQDANVYAATWEELRTRIPSLLAEISR
jgi:protein-tyrosine-phosphatase